MSNVDSEGEKEEHGGCSASPASHGHGARASLASKQARYTSANIVDVNITEVR